MSCDEKNNKRRKKRSKQSSEGNSHAPKSVENREGGKAVQTHVNSSDVKFSQILYNSTPKSDNAPKAGTPCIDGERCLLCHKERYDKLKKGELKSLSCNSTETLVSQVPLWVCPDCRRNIEEEERRAALEPSSPSNFQDLKQKPTLNLTLSITTKPNGQEAKSHCQSCNRSCVKPDVINDFAKEKERQQLRCCWGEVRNIVRCIYREAGTSLAGSVVAIIVAVWILSSLAGSMIEFLPLEQEKFYGIIITVAFFFTPLIVILVAYGTIFHIARAHARGRDVSSFKKDLRIATTVAVVIGLFVICWTPFFGINFAFAVCIATLFKGAGCPGLMTLLTWILSVNKWLQYGNSVCNPVIYGFRNKDFRRAFRKILLGLCCKKVRLSDYSKSAYGRTVRSAYLRRESSLENSRSVILPPNVSLGMFAMRDSYRKAMQSGRSKPIKLKFTPKKSVANGLLSINVDAFRTSNQFTSSTSVWNSSSEASVSPGGAL